MNIAVFLGGISAERDVSVVSGAQVVSALRSRGHSVVAVDTASGVLGKAEEEILFSATVAVEPPTVELGESEGKRLVKILSNDAVAKAELIFIALHGGAGEDGRLQAFLDLMGKRYTGSGATGAAIAWDKDIAKKLFLHAGIPTAAWLMAPVSEVEIASKLGYPVIVKSSKQGSSVGMSVVNEAGKVENAISMSLKHDDEVMIERFIPGREFTVGILGDEALSVGEIIPKKGIFDYEAKYQQGASQEIFPADLAPSVSDKLLALALKVHQTLKLKGFSRVDFRMNHTGELFCLEANTVPGLTQMSLLPKSARAVGIEFPELCERICKLAMKS